jgi:hypothetical protein
VRREAGRQARSRGVSLGPVEIRSRLDALIYQLVDRVFELREQEPDLDQLLRRSAQLCSEFERDLLRLRAREEIALYDAERLERLVQLLRDTDPGEFGASG